MVRGETAWGERDGRAKGPGARAWAWLFPAPAGIGSALLGHQRQALRRQVSVLVFVTWAISALTAAVFYPLVAPALNLAWVGLVWLMGGLSLWRWSQSRRIAEPRPATARFVQRTILANAVPGIVWGASALIFFIPGRMDLQVFLVCVLAGMSAGIVAAAPSMPAAALSFVMPAMLPMTIQLLGTGVRTGVVMGIMAVIYVCALVFLLRNGYRSFCDGVAAEERARQAEEVLRDSIEALSDGYVLYDAELRVVRHNRRYLDYVPELPAGEPVVGQTYERLMRVGRARGFFSDEDEIRRSGEGAMSAWMRSLRSREEASIERKLADGRTLLARKYPMASGGCVVILSDITALKRAEHRLIAAIEAMDDGFVLYGPDERIVVHNHRYLEQYPQYKDMAPLVGRTSRELIQRLAETRAFRGIEKAGGAEHWTREQLEVVRAQRATEFERETADGRTYLIRTQRTGESGRVAITTDVTALKRAEKRLVDAVESMSDAFVLWDADDRLVLTNSAYAKMFEGVPRATEAGGRFEDILRAGIDAGAFPEAKGREEAYIAERLERHRNPADPVVQPYREGRWLRYSERRTSEGGVVGLRSDVTDAMRREQALRFNEAELANRVRELETMHQQLHQQRDELQLLMRQVMQARDEAAAANAAKSVFLANMSHELRTPLNAIIGFSEIMNSELFGALGHPRYAGYVGDMLGAAKHLLKLINDILDLSKIEAGKWELREEPVDVRRMLDGVMRLFRGRDDRLEIEVDAPVLPLIMADERALKQVLINALSNSIKFTPPGGRIRLRARRDESGRLHLAIADTGIGINREDVQKALAPFGQVDNHMTRRHQGTGLGLPIAKALVERHGGRLRLRSRPGRGTVIVAMLPAERFAAAAKAQASLVAAE
jgi:signal transduction histidine kinase